MAISNNHYVVAEFGGYRSKSIRGRVYAPSRKKAQLWIDENYPGCKALLFSACAIAIKRREDDYPVLLGQPTEYAQGRPSSPNEKFTVSVRLGGDIAAKYRSIENKGVWVAELVTRELTK